MLGDGDCVNVLRGHSGRVRCVQLSVCGRELYSGGDDATIVKWDAGTGGKLLVMDGHADVVWTLALARQSAVLYSGSGDCTVRAWDTNAGACIQIISEQRGWIRALAISPMIGVNQSENRGESLFTGSLNWFIEARATASNQILQRIPSGVGRLDLIQALAVTDDGTMLYSGGTGCVIKGWDVENAMCTKKLEGHTDTVFSICLTKGAGSRLWSSSGDYTIRAWRLMDSTCIQSCAPLLDGFGFQISTSCCVAELLHCCMEAGSQDRTRAAFEFFPLGTAAAWIAVGSCEARRVLHMLMVWFACASSTGADDNAPATVESHALLEGHGPTEGIHSLALDEDAGKLYSGGGDSTIRVWQVGLPKKWSTETHGQFPKRLRDAVKELLKISYRDEPCETAEKDGLRSLPPPMTPPYNLLYRIRLLEPSLLKIVVKYLAQDISVTRS